MVVTNIWNICFLGELGPFHGGSALLPNEGALFPKKLGPFTRGNLLLPRKLSFSLKNFSYSL
jgi:hypothetical protein